MTKKKDLIIERDALLEQVRALRSQLADCQTLNDQLWQARNNALVMIDKLKKQIGELK